MSFETFIICLQCFTDGDTLRRTPTLSFASRGVLRRHNLENPVVVLRHNFPFPEFQMATSPNPLTQPDSMALTASEQIRQAYSTRNWFRAVERAITGFNARGLLRRVHSAEQALFNRWTGMTDSLEDQRERQAMEAAAQKLRDIKIYVLGWPGL